jgi:dihydrofolate synthase/folylpolyglutamate synthase
VGGWQYLSKQIARQECVHKRIVFGMVDDKDIETVMSMLPKDAAYFFTQPSTHRAFPKEKVAEIGKKLGLQGDVYPTVESAYMAARAVSRDMDFIFIGGSSYVVADLLSSDIKFPS